MAIAVYSEGEMRNLAMTPDTVFKSKIMGMSLKDVLIFRRNLQISLAQYTKNARLSGKTDMMQIRIIQHCGTIERMARATFLSATLPRALRVGATSGLTPAKIKSDVLKKWEKLIARSSY